MFHTTFTSPVGDNEARVEVELSHHCIERFIQRVRPCLERNQAEEQLARLVANSCVRVRCPDWMGSYEAGEADAWANIGPSIALPLVSSDDRYVATTVLVSNGRRDLSLRRPNRLALNARMGGRR